MSSPKKFFKKYLGSALLKFFGILAGKYLRFFPTVDFQKIIRRQERKLISTFNQGARLQKILDRPIRYFDIGARAGPSLNILSHKEFIEFYLSEPDQEEAERLRQQGYRVIDEAIYFKEGRAILNITAKPGSSSLLEPGPLTKIFFLPWKFKVVKKVEVSTTTIEAVARRFSTSFDIIKIDTQGTEMDILSATGSQKPLFISTEVSLLPLYKEQKLFYDIIQYVKDRGYMIGDLSITNYKPISLKDLPKSALRGHGIPLHGEVVFMPDWTNEKGRLMIEKNDRVYAALMLIFGMESVLRLVLASIETPNKKLILKALQ